MKNWFRTLLCLVFIAFLAACGGSDDDGGGSAQSGGNPGEIPGLGEYPGELQGDAFTLPNGVVLMGSIQGIDGSWFSVKASSLVQQALANKTARPPVFYTDPNPIQKAFPANEPFLGSGFDVTLHIPLRNTNTTATTVVFPARLIIKAKSSADQNGILLKETRVTIPAGAEYKVTLAMYCTNLQRAGFSPNTWYEWGVISNSSQLIDLTDRLVNKKINVEEYDIIVNSRTPWMSSEYWAIYERLADIVWNLTDRGIALSESDKAWIQALPNSN